jgi:molybdate transport system substrate-binding protein
MADVSDGADDLTVMISGGFALAYQAVLPAFAAMTGLRVRTLSGASQGQGPKTMRHQLEHGAAVDVVILSDEGLHDLSEAGWIAAGSSVALARAPLAAAVRTGTPAPEIGSAAALARSLSAARRVVMPGSTSGLFLRDVVFPRLGIADTVRALVVARGTESAAALAAGEADIALGPVSELVAIPGITVVGPLPDAVQLVQTFSAALLRRARHVAAARQLTAFLASDRTTAAIRSTGMVPAEPGPTP